MLILKSFELNVIIYKNKEVKFKFNVKTQVIKKILKKFRVFTIIG